MTGTAALLLPLLLARGEPAGAACRVEPASWTDTLADLSCLGGRRNLKLTATGGVTVDPGEILWSWPADQRFSAGNVEGTLEVAGKGSTGETVSLWQRAWEPGAPLEVATTCVPIGTTPCPGSTAIPPVLGKADGLVHASGLAGCPGFATGADAAGWDTVAGPGVPVCAGGGAPAGVYGGITPFNGQRILWGGGLQDLVAGAPYAVTFLATANHDATTGPYLEFQMVNRTTNLVQANWTVNENQLALPLATSFAGLTAVSVGFAPPAGPAVWDARVLAKSGTDNHCTLLGPVYVTAQQGAVTPPVFDSLSDDTAWQKVEWEVDQNAQTADPSCACPTPGSPITPVRVEWGVGATPAVAPAAAVPGPLPDAGQEPVPMAATGRYLAMRATLFGRRQAKVENAAMDVTDSHLHFAGWRPVVRRLSVRYFARAAEAVSRPVAPTSLKAWGTLTWDAETPGASTAHVDVLDPSGTVLFADVARSVSLAASLDPFRWPAIMLRARLACDPAVPANRPVLKGWRVDWTPQPGRVTLKRNAIRPAAGDVVNGLVSVEREGRVRVRVHDASGRTVVVLIDGWHAAAAVPFAWDGRGSDGTPVAPGTYFVNGVTAAGAGTRKVAVLR